MAEPGLAEQTERPFQIHPRYPAPTGEPVYASRPIHLIEAVLLQSANETPSLPGDAVHRSVGLCQPSCVRPDNLLPLPTQRPKRASRCPPRLTRYRTRPGSIPVRFLGAPRLGCVYGRIGPFVSDLSMRLLAPGRSGRGGPARRPSRFVPVSRSARRGDVHRDGIGAATTLARLHAQRVRGSGLLVQLARDADDRRSSRGWRTCCPHSQPRSSMPPSRSRPGRRRRRFPHRPPPTRTL